MEKRLIIKIRRPTQSGVLIWLLTVMPFLFGVLNDILRLPWAVRYTLDLAWMLLVVLLWRSGGRNERRQIRTLVVWVILFLVYTFCVYLVQYQSGLYYLWGVRNNFRLYAAFFAVAAFLTQEQAESYLRLFDGLFWVNVVVSLIQYFGMGLSGDYLGGLFGVEKGANAYTNIFFVIILTRTLVLYLEGKMGIRSCIVKSAAMLMVAVLAELKFFFVEVLLIIALAVLLTGFSWRKFWVVLGGIAAVFAGALMIAQLFPVFEGWFSPEAILKSALSNRGYTGSGDLNRLNAIPIIDRLWLTNLWERLFGLGLGNCDTASFELLNSPFFKRYGHMHYSWLSYAYMYLECGWIGLLFFVGFFAKVFFGANRIRGRSDGVIGSYSRMAMILAVVCVMITVYNSSLRTEAGYMMYFVLALPFVEAEKPAAVRSRMK